MLLGHLENSDSFVAKNIIERPGRIHPKSLLSGAFASEITAYTNNHHFSELAMNLWALNWALISPPTPGQPAEGLSPQILHCTNRFQSQESREKSLCSPSLHPRFHSSLNICFLRTISSCNFWDMTPCSVNAAPSDRCSSVFFVLFPLLGLYRSVTP